MGTRFIDVFRLKKSRIAWLVVFWLLHHYSVPSRVFNWFKKKKEEWRLAYIMRWTLRYNPEGPIWVRSIYNLRSTVDDFNCISSTSNPSTSNEQVPYRLSFGERPY